MSSEKLLPFKASAQTPSLIRLRLKAEPVQSEPYPPRKTEDTGHTAAFGKTAGNFFQITDVQLFHNRLLKLLLTV